MMNISKEAVGVLSEYFKHEYPLSLQNISQGLILSIPSGLVVPMFNHRIYSAAKPINKQAASIDFMKQIKTGNMMGISRKLFVNCIYAPIVEEILFRSLIQRGVIKTIQKDNESLPSKIERVLITATLFSANHFHKSGGWRLNVCLLTGTFISGVMFSTITELTDNILCSTFAHMTLNANVAYKQFRISGKCRKHH